MPARRPVGSGDGRRTRRTVGNHVPGACAGVVNGTPVALPLENWATWAGRGGDSVEDPALSFILDRMLRVSLEIVSVARRYVRTMARSAVANRNRDKQPTNSNKRRDKHCCRNLGRPSRIQDIYRYIYILALIPSLAGWVSGSALARGGFF